MPDYPFKHGGSENGGTVRFFKGLARGELPKWDFTPTFMWQIRISYLDLVGPSATQAAAITISAVGFVTGRITATFTGYGLAVPVDVVADAAVGDVNTDLATALAGAINTAAATSLDGVVELAAETAEVVDISFVDGVAEGAVTVAYRPAQQTTATFSGTLTDGEYALTFGGAVSPSVPVTTTRAASVPAALGDMADQAEIDVEGEGALSGFVVSANSDTVDEILVVFEPDVETVTVTSSISPLSWSCLVSGSTTNGDYTLTFSHASLPADVPATVTRVGGVPVTNDDIVAALQVAVESNPQLTMLVASAVGSAVTDTVTVLAFPGVTGLTVTPSAPSPGMLSAVPVAYTVVDATPTGPTPTVSHSSTLDLEALGNARSGRFPKHVHRNVVALEVTEAYGSGQTVTIGTAVDTDALMTSTAIDATGRTLHTTAAAQHAPQYAGELVPVVDVDLGTTPSLTQGVMFVQIDCTPHVSMTSRFS